MGQKAFGFSSTSFSYLYKNCDIMPLKEFLKWKNKHLNTTTQTQIVFAFFAFSSSFCLYAHFFFQQNLSGVILQLRVCLPARYYVIDISHVCTFFHTFTF